MNDKVSGPVSKPEFKIDIPHIDISQAMVDFANDSDLYILVLRTFMTSSPPILAKLRNVSEETLHSCYVKTHGLKGNLGNIYAEDLRAEAAVVEALAKEGDLEGYKLALAPFLEKIELFLADVRAWFESYDAKK